MRVLFLIAVVSVAGCDRSPASLGITGPGAAPNPSVNDGTISAPGVPDSGGTYYGPSMGPIQPTGRYFNYN